MLVESMSVVLRFLSSKVKKIITHFIYKLRSWIWVT